MADLPPVSQPTGPEPGAAALSDVDSELRAFVRDLGLPGRPRPSDPPQLPAGTKVAPHLEVLRVLGRGAAGVVYLARDTRLRRDVAVKLVPAGTATAAARLQREAQAMAQLTHPNVVTVHEVGAFGGELYIAMEHVEGGTLRRWLAEAPRPWPQVVGAFIQAAHGLHAAHAAGILHRDFKPDNVLIGQGRVRVGDFGLAWARPSDAPEDPEATPDGDTLGDLTATRAVVGTPAYLAPEVVLRRESGPRADQFALGVSLFEALCGQRPYPSPGAWAASESTLRRPDPELPAWLRGVVLRAVALDPAARFPDVLELASALEHGMGRAGRRRRAIAVGAIAVLAVVGGMGLGTSLRPDECAELGGAVATRWNPERRAEVIAAMEATGSSLATAAIVTVTTELDAWAAAWAVERRGACEATRVRGEQSEARLDLRMDCLDRAAVELGALVDVLREADAEVVARTDELLSRLGSPALCTDPGLPPTVDAVPPSRRETYDPLLAAVLAAETRAAAGDLRRARAELDELATAVDAEGWPWLAARTHLARGTVLAELGWRQEAIEELAAAHALALATTDRALLGRVLHRLARALGRTTTGTEEALRLLRAAGAAAEHAGLRDIERVDLDTARVEVLHFGERHPQAERAAREALERTATGHAGRPRLLTMLATSLDRQHRFEEALAVHREAVAEAEAQRGPEHPKVASTLGNLAETLRRMDRPEDALVALRRGLRIREAALGPDAPSVGETRRQIGDALFAAGDVRGSIAEYERALAIHRLAGDEAGMVFVLSNLANRRADFDDLEAGTALLLEAVPLAERHYGVESAMVARLEANVMNMCRRRRDPESARAHGQRALALAERALGPDDVLVSTICVNLGPVVAELGDIEAGLGLLERAERIAAATLPPKAPDHAEILNARADVLLSAERPLEAAQVRARALAAFERLHGEDHPNTIFMRFMVGRDLVAAGEHAQAIEPLERCLGALGHVAYAPDRAARIRWVLAEALWPDLRARPRASRLAREALGALEALGHASAPDLRAWMAERRIHT